jgi:hypothetical protein
MAFNVKDFIKDDVKAPLNRIIDSITRAVSNGKPNSAKGVAESTAKSFFDIASSFESTSAFSSAKTDSIVAGDGDEFYAFAGKNSQRASKADLSSLRRLSSEDTKSYLKNVNPATKIGAVKKDNSVDIITVL